MKLLVARTRHKADMIAAALELDQAEWHTAGVGDGLCGRTFTKVVVMGYLCESSAELIAVEKYIAHCKAQIEQPGVLVVVLST